MPAPATQYDSTRLVHNFVRKDSNVIQNGTLAMAGTFSTLADNQHWLVMTDQPMINFYTSRRTTGNGIWSGASSKVVTLTVPPFGQYAAFHFLVTRDFTNTSSTLSYLDIASSVDSRRTTAIPCGEDLSVTSKAGGLTLESACWIHFSQPSSNPTDSDPGALKLFPWTLEYWRTVDVTVTVAANVVVLAAAYQMLPNTEVYRAYA